MPNKTKDAGVQVSAVVDHRYQTSDFCTEQGEQNGLNPSECATEYSLPKPILTISKFDIEGSACTGDFAKSQIMTTGKKDNGARGYIDGTIESIHR